MTTEKEYPPIKFVRLKNGDDVICELMEWEENSVITYTLINPFKVVYVPASPKGYVHIAFMPWVFTSICDKQEFMIKETDVMMINDVSSYMQKYYWETMEGPEDQSVEEEMETTEEKDLESLKDIIDKLGLNTKRTMH